MGKNWGQSDLTHFVRKKQIKSSDPFRKLMGLGPFMKAMGLGRVEILVDTLKVDGENFYLEFHLHSSVEAEGWSESSYPVCTLCSGYTSGWITEALTNGVIPIYSVEVECESTGKSNCCKFMVSSVNTLEENVQNYLNRTNNIKQISTVMNKMNWIFVDTYQQRN